MTTDNPQEQSEKNAHCPEPDYTHPDEMPIVEQRPNHHSDLRGMIVHFTSEMLDNPNNYGIYPTTNFYNAIEEAILDWHKKYELQAYSDGFQKASKGAFKSQQAAKLDERNKIALDTYRGKTVSESTNWQSKFEYFMDSNERRIAELKSQQEEV